MNTLRALGAFTLFFAVSLCSAQEDAHTFLARMDAKSKELASWTSVQLASNNGPMAESSSRSEIQAKRSAQGLKQRITTKAKSVIKNAAITNQVETLMVSDGVVVHNEIMIAGQLSVTKSHAVSGDLTGVRRYLDAGTGTVTGSESVLERPCTTIEIVIPTGNPMEGTHKFWFDDATGMMMKSELRGPMIGQMSTQLEKFEPGANVADELFNYVVPEGATVTDNTKPPTPVTLTP